MLTRVILSRNPGLVTSMCPPLLTPTTPTYVLDCWELSGTFLKRLLASSGAGSDSALTSLLVAKGSEDPTKLPSVALTSTGSPSLNRALSDSLEMKISLSSFMLYLS